MSDRAGDDDRVRGAGSERTNPEADLVERVDELERSLRELRREIEPRRRRGPVGLPRPPTPGELLRLADRRAIPAAVALLEAQVRALELLQETLRLLDTGRPTDRAEERARERAARAGSVTLERLEDALDAVQRDLESGALPSDPTARSLLEDARRLTGEIEARVREATDTADAERARGRDAERGEAIGRDPDGHRRRDPDRRAGRTGDPESVHVDVESELQTIKDELEDAEGDRGSGDDEGRDDGGRDDGESGDGDGGRDGNRGRSDGEDRDGGD